MAAFLLLAGWQVLAQTGSGTIQGTVTDPTSAVVPGAKVRITHLATSVTRETTANPVGFYTFPQSPIGQYEITVEAAGMASWKAQLEVTTGETATLDVTLKLASSATEIVVADNMTSLVTDSSPTIGQILEQTRIEQLPLNGRNLTTLLGTTVPGAEGTRINGMVDAAFELVQDGAIIRNLDTSSVQGAPGLDTVDEFRVETSVSSMSWWSKSSAPPSTVRST